MRKNGRLSVFYMGLVIVFLYLPILCVVLYSFNESKSGAVWTGFTFKWYGDLLMDSRIGSAFWVSFRVAILTSILSAFLGTLGAIAVDNLSPKVKSAVSAFIYLPLIIPEIILGIALLIFFSLTPLPFGITTLVIAHSTFCIPYVFIMVSIRLRGISKSLTEAARDLGATKSHTLRTVILPLVMPSVLTGALLSVAMSLDDVVISTFVSGPTSLTLPVHIFSMIKLGVSPIINALCSIILLFTFTVVGVLQYTNKHKED